MPYAPQSVGRVIPPPIEQATSTSDEVPTSDPFTGEFGYFTQLLNDTSIPKITDLGPDIGFEDKATIVPADAKLLYRLQTHDTKGWVLVYDTTQLLRIIFASTSTRQGFIVANSYPVTYTGNSGGVWFPVAFTKDDTKIIMCAEMGDPGAGGSLVSYGCDLLPIKPVTPSEKEAYLWTQSHPGNEVDTQFMYDSNGKTIYTEQGNKTPHHSQPGPGTSSVIMFRDLTTNVTKRLLEETDTTYALEALDEKKGTLTFEATKYRFPSGCIRGDGGISDESLDCADIASTSTRTLRLP